MLTIPLPNFHYNPLVLYTHATNASSYPAPSLKSYFIDAQTYHWPLPPFTAKNIRTILAMAMEARSISQSHLAHNVGLSQPTISMFLSGKTTLLLNTYNRIAYSLAHQYLPMIFPAADSPYSTDVIIKPVPVFYTKAHTLSYAYIFFRLLHGFTASDITALTDIDPEILEKLEDNNPTWPGNDTAHQLSRLFMWDQFIMKGEEKYYAEVVL
ncbi:MAG: helix-turn-helix transcriptional regulator [Synergistaceae bacterium]|nr:helix-turn-helix transcriptional regulator [Synergistaceae bacterium]